MIKQKKKPDDKQFNYIIKEKLVNNKLTKVKVYESQADIYIREWRQRKEVAPTTNNNHRDQM